MEIRIEEDLFAKEALYAEENRRVFRERGICPLNLLAGPGAGKTSLIRQTYTKLSVPVAVIEGDPASSIDTELLNSLGIQAVQINTEGGCHLDALMIGKALQTMELKRGSLLFIENVGNLICTASYPLGETLRVVMHGVSEGDDKPFKYPEIFQTADAVILNKMDLLPYVDFQKDRFYQGIHSLNPNVPVFELSAKEGSGFGPWVEWLSQHYQIYFDERA